MLTRYKIMAVAALLAIMAALAWTAMHYRDNAIAYKKQRDDANDTVQTMQRQQVVVAELDAKYTKELSDAKETIAQLNRDVAAGTKRLSVRAVCVSKTSSTGSVGDAGTAELASDARQDYYRLREQLKTSDKQIRYLQDYIRKLINASEK